MNSDSSKAIKLSKGNDFIGVCLDNDSIFANWAGLKGTFPDIYFNKKALPAFSGIQPEDKPREEVRVSPNPFSDELDITILKKPVDELVRVSLFDLNGRELYSKSYSVYRSGSLRLSFPGLARGKYILRVNCSLFNFKQKVEKM